MNVARILSIPLVLSLLAGGLAHAQTAQPVQPTPPVTAPLTQGGLASVGTVISPDRASTYRLGAGDKVRVLVYGDENSSSGSNNEYSVNGDGVISLPLIGNVIAAGKTEVELQSEIVNKLKDGYFKDPKVSLEITTYRPFYILGEVNKPGAYPYINGLTVYSAVATAGGFTYRANTKKVYIKRLGEPKETKMPLSPTTDVEAGDTIRIVERIF